MSRRQQVLVVGPPLAGVGGVVEALRARLPEHAVLDADGLDPRRAPDAVVAVVSAVAPVAGSDWDLIARATARTDLVVGAVSKIDAHRNWRDVLEADRALVSRWDPARRAMPWVGVAAAPQLGEPNVADLAAALRDGLADPTLSRRNSLRCNEYRLASSRARQPRGAAESRVALQRVRLRLPRFVRAGCASLRAELRAEAAMILAGGAGRFEARVRGDVARFVTELDREITRAVADAAAELALDGVETARLAGVAELAPPHVDRAPSSSRRLETRLVAVLGLGFGLGIALASNRLLSGLAPGLSVVGWVAGGLIGSTLVAWVVRTRGVLHDRAVLDRWVTDVAATLRWHGEAMIAERLLTVESARSAGPTTR